MISESNHVKFMQFVLLAINEEAKKILFFIQCTIKQFLDSVFVLSRIIKVLLRGFKSQVISLSFG